MVSDNNVFEDEAGFGEPEAESARLTEALPKKPRTRVEKDSDTLRNVLTIFVILASLAALTISGLSLERNISAAQEASEKAQRTNMALCGIRQATHEQQVAGIEFLNDHPKGVAGVPPSFFIRAIKRRTVELEALSVLDCREFLREQENRKRG